MILLASVLMAAALAGDPPAETAAPSPAPKPTETKPAPPPVPTLDDLLGTKPQKPAPQAPTTDKPADKPSDVANPPDAARADLDRLLSGEEMGEAFKEAVALMGDAAKRLETSKDTGIDTQRVQEDVVRRLDQLLASLQQQQQQSSSSSSSQSQQQQDKQQNKNQPNQKKPGQKQNQQTSSGQGDRDWDGPPKQEGQLKSALDSARAAWGSLPARVRDMLLQGSEDPFSARYRAMTEQYYKRLAEERGK